MTLKLLTSPRWIFGLVDAGLFTSLLLSSLSGLAMRVAIAAAVSAAAISVFRIEWIEKKMDLIIFRNSLLLAFVFAVIDVALNTSLDVGRGLNTLMVFGTLAAIRLVLMRFFYYVRLYGKF